MKPEQPHHLVGREVVIRDTVRTNILSKDLDYQGVVLRIALGKRQQIVHLQNARPVGHSKYIPQWKYLGRGYGQTQMRPFRLSDPSINGAPLPDDCMAFSFLNSSIVEISGVKLSTIYGTNIKEWPMMALQIFFLRKVCPYTRHISQLAGLWGRSFQEKQALLDLIDICRRVDIRKLSAATGIPPHKTRYELLEGIINI